MCFPVTDSDLKWEGEDVEFCGSNRLNLKLIFICGNQTFNFICSCIAKEDLFVAFCYFVYQLSK